MMKKLTLLCLLLGAILSMASCHSSKHNTSENAQDDGPSDVDILDLPITETLQIDVLLDDFENVTNSLRRLYKDNAENGTAIQNLLNRAVRITEKINEGSTHMTQTQLDRYEKLTDEFLEAIKD